MLLTATTDKLSLITEQTSEVDVVVAYIDRVTSTGAIGAAVSQRTTIATATTTDVLSAPSSNTTRKVLGVTIRNVHASASQDVRLQFNANGTLYELFGARLYPGDLAIWTEEEPIKIIKAKAVFFGRSVKEGNSVSILGINNLVAHSDIFCIPRSPKQNLTRKIGGFSFYNHFSSINTTGFQVGFRCVSLTGSVSAETPIETQIQSVLNSVTGATLVCQSSTSNASPLQCATGATATAPGMLACAYIFTEGTTLKDHVRFYFGAASEVANSAVNFETGSIFEVFENTD